MSGRILQYLIGLTLCFHFDSCSLPRECYGFEAYRSCACREFGNVVFEPSPPQMLANLGSPWAYSFIGMSKEWFLRRSPDYVNYRVYIEYNNKVQSNEFLQDCTIAAENHQRERVMCGVFGLLIEMNLPLSHVSDGMRLTEPKPFGDPEDVTAITISREDPLWKKYIEEKPLDISGTWFMVKKPRVTYYPKSGQLRLERVKGNRWSFTVKMEYFPTPEMEELLKKYYLWAESIRFSATCECDVGSYQVECTAWD